MKAIQLRGGRSLIHEEQNDDVIWSYWANSDDKVSIMKRKLNWKKSYTSLQIWESMSLIIEGLGYESIKAVMANESSKFTLKLLVDSRSNKVLFAEAGKDFVDFLFGLLTLPMGSVIKLLTPRIMVGSIGKVYQSVENLNETYLVAKRDKSALLKPMFSSNVGVSPLLLGGTETMNDLKYYCNNCNKKVTTARNINCPVCRRVMGSEMDFVLPSVRPSSTEKEGDSAGGFVKGVITYMITDNLEVTPMSAISSITLISRFSLKKDVQLEEKVVTVGVKEGLGLLEASLKSLTALTDVFLTSTTKKAKVSV